MNWFDLCNRRFVFFRLGRVHSAIVASINEEMRCATVEWFESGETKGKEVDLSVIESLNPEITILRPGENQNRPAEQPEMIRLQRVIFS